MKKAFLISCLWLAGWSASGQVFVDNINLNDVEGMEHILMMAFLDGIFSQHFTIWVNYGQKNNKDSVVQEDGKPKQFSSNISALNYFYENGWDLNETFLIERVNPFTKREELVFYHFMRRKK